VEYPASKAAFDDLIAESGGNLWVKATPTAGAPSDRWIVFAPDGTATAQVDVPTGLELLYVDETHMLAKWTDEFDVEFVRSYRVER
jgi:hypothetical protein